MLEGDPCRESRMLEGEQHAGGRAVCWRESGILKGDSCRDSSMLEGEQHAREKCLWRELSAGGRGMLGGNEATSINGPL